MHCLPFAGEKNHGLFVFQAVVPNRKEKNIRITPLRKNWPKQAVGQLDKILNLLFELKETKKEEEEGDSRPDRKCLKISGKKFESKLVLSVSSGVVSPYTSESLPVNGKWNHSV